MLELPTIKTDFLFENSQDFNQTTHARPQHPIVFIHNISLYFNLLVLWNMFSKGHVTVTSCLFLQYDPSLEIFNMVFNTLWNIWHGPQHSFQHGSYHRWIFMFEMCWKHLEKAFWKFQNVLKSVMHFENYVSTLLEMLDMVFSMPWNF